MTRFARVVEGVAWRHLHNFLRKPALLLPPLFLPLFLFAAFAGALSALEHTPGFRYPAYGSFVFVFVLVQAAAFGGVFTGYSMAEDFESGFGRRLALAAPHRVAILLGYAVAAVVRMAGLLAILFAVAVATGTHARAGAWQLVALIGLVLLTNVAATFFTTGIAIRTRTVQASPLMQVPMFVVLFLAPVFVPRELLTGWLHAVASVNPMTVVLDSARQLFVGKPSSVALAFSLLAALTVLAALFALRSLRRAEAAGFAPAD